MDQAPGHTLELGRGHEPASALEESKFVVSRMMVPQISTSESLEPVTMLSPCKKGLAEVTDLGSERTALWWAPCDPKGKAGRAESVEDGRVEARAGPPQTRKGKDRGFEGRKSVLGQATTFAVTGSSSSRGQTDQGGQPTFWVGQWCDIGKLAPRGERARAGEATWRKWPVTRDLEGGWELRRASRGAGGRQGAASGTEGLRRGPVQEEGPGCGGGRGCLSGALGVCTLA